MRDACASHDLSLMEAIDAAKDIFPRNSIEFYKLGISTSSCSPQSIISLELHTESDDQEDSRYFVRIIWVDASGQQRCRIVQAQRFNKKMKKNGIGLTFATMGMPSFSDGPAERSNLTVVGEVRLVSDLSIKPKIPWTTQESMVLADMVLNPGKAWKYCPRETLRRVTKKFSKMNLAWGGKEEYVVPFDFGPYCSTSSFDVASPIFLEIVPALESLNIAVEQVTNNLKSFID